MTKIICLILCSFYSFAQIKTGSITYKIVFENKTEQDLGPLKDYYNSAVKASQYVHYELNFTADKMCFSEQKTLELDKTSLSFLRGFSGMLGDVFKEKKDTFFLQKVSNPKVGEFLLKSAPTDKGWTITKTTKSISGFLCYKAIAEETVVNESGVFKKPLVAWFCPKIPFPFGPLGYGNLPGIILELEKDGNVWGATKISLDNNKPLVAIPNLKVITEKEYAEMAKKAME